MQDEPAVITAARNGDLEALRRLIDEDPALANARGWMGETPLHSAAASSGVAGGRAAGAVRMLLEAGAQARSRRDNGDTPLHRAATGEIAELLIKAIREGTPDQHNEHGQTPLHCARDGGVAEVLLRHRASLTAKDLQGLTPLHGATADKARVLLSAGADIDALDGDGRTPLHHAVWDGDAKLIALLLAEGADPTVRDNGGSSPIHLARSRGPQEIRALLPTPRGSLTEPEIVAGRPQHALRMGRDGSTVFSIAEHALLVRWRLGRSRTASGPPPHPEVIAPTEHSTLHDLAVHPQLPLVAVAPSDAPVELRNDDFTEPVPLYDLEDFTTLAFSPNGKWLAAAGHERVVLVNLETRQITDEVEGGERTDCLDFSPDSSLLATTCSFQGGAHVRVDAVTPDGRLVPRAEIDRPDCDTIPAAVFAPDGRYLVIWQTSAIYHDRLTAGWRGVVLLADTAGAVIWQRTVDAKATGVRTALAAAGSPMGWFTRPSVTADRIGLGLDDSVLLLRTSDGTPLAVRRVRGDVTEVTAAPIIAATDQGLRRLDTKWWAVGHHER